MLVPHLVMGSRTLVLLVGVLSTLGTLYLSGKPPRSIEPSTSSTRLLRLLSAPALRATGLSDTTHAGSTADPASAHTSTSSTLTDTNANVLDALSTTIRLVRILRRSATCCLPSSESLSRGRRTGTSTRASTYATRASSATHESLHGLRAIQLLPIVTAGQATSRLSVAVLVRLWVSISSANILVALLLLRKISTIGVALGTDANGARALFLGGRRCGARASGRTASRENGVLDECRLRRDVVLSVVVGRGVAVTGGVRRLVVVRVHGRGSAIGLRRALGARLRLGGSGCGRSGGLRVLRGGGGRRWETSRGRVALLLEARKALDIVVQNATLAETRLLLTIRIVEALIRTIICEYYPFEKE